MKIINKQFGRTFEEIKDYEAGIQLNGDEVKAVKEGRMKLEGAYVKIINGEVFLINAEIHPYSYGNKDIEIKRKRKLLLTKKEIIQLQTKLKSGKALTIIPKSCYNKGRWIKLKIALVKARKEVGKRRIEKAKKIQREIEKEIKYTIKRRG